MIERQDMHEGLRHLLQQLTPLSEAVERWGSVDLSITDYLSPQLPPRELITSVRAVVLCGKDVLVVRDPGGVHILPGGRCEAGEALLQTLQREILEEAGWALKNVHLLGFRHFSHLSVKPADYPYPYPDFCQVVYAAQADTYAPESKQFDEYVLETYFHPIAETQALPLMEGERLYLATAVSSMGPGSLAITDL